MVPEHKDSAPLLWLRIQSTGKMRNFFWGGCVILMLPFLVLFHHYLNQQLPLRSVTGSSQTGELSWGWEASWTWGEGRGNCPLPSCWCWVRGWCVHLVEAAATQVGSELAGKVPAVATFSCLRRSNYLIERQGPTASTLFTQEQTCSMFSVQS